MKTSPLKAPISFLRLRRDPAYGTGPSPLSMAPPKMPQLLCLGGTTVAIVIAILVLSTGQVAVAFYILGFAALGLSASSPPAA